MLASINRQQGSEEQESRTVSRPNQRRRKAKNTKTPKKISVVKAKRGSEKHSDFLYNLKNLMSVAEFTTMTSGEMFIYLFAETADNTISRPVLEILAGSKPSVTELRTKVMDLELFLKSFVMRATEVMGTLEGL